MITRCRCLLVWLVVSALAAATARWAWAAVAPSDRFDDLAVADAGVALAACAGWAWLVCSVVVAQALTDPQLAARHTVGVPAWAARAVLAACGVAALAVAPAAHASYDAPQHDHAPTAGLDGLPFPDRAVGPAHAARAPATARPGIAGSVVVRSGDSLWRLAAESLSDTASDAEIADATAALVELNRDAVGADPDLIHPGLRLRTPWS